MKYENVRIAFRYMQLFEIIKHLSLYLQSVQLCTNYTKGYRMVDNKISRR